MNPAMQATFEQLMNIPKFCPVCAKELEIHPFGANKVCFVHGDFIIKSNKGILTLEWDPTIINPLRSNDA